MARASTAPAKLHWAQRFVIWLSHNWPALVTLIGSIALALSGVASTFFPTKARQDATVWTFIGGAAVTLIGTVGAFATGPKVAALVKRADDNAAVASVALSAVHKAMSGLLAEMLKALNLYNDTCRASIYVYKEDAFFILGRSSKNPELSKLGRSSYPAGQGIIAAAWASSIKVLRDLPADRDEWNKRMADTGVPLDVAARLGMQARSLVAMRLERDDTRGSARHVGVAVFEGLGPKEVALTVVDRAKALHEWNALWAVMESAAEELPDVVKARASTTSSS